tara:strand:- start:107 stop:1306 length:1200 start_codon:yes stop_codon:yes gene_type:complete
MEAEIAVTDIQGRAEKVLTKYEVHTISLVGTPALGVNGTKLKSNNAESDTKERSALEDKVEKAKALDAQESADIESTKVDSVESATIDVAPEEVSPQVVAKEAPVDEATPELVSEEVIVDATQEASEANVSKQRGDSDDDEETEEERLERLRRLRESRKAFTTEERTAAGILTFQGVDALITQIQAAAPNADGYEIWTLVRNVADDLTDAVINEDSMRSEQIFTEVMQEVTQRVNAAKALQIQETGSIEDKTKALEALHPELAVLVRESRAKAVKLEEDAKLSERAKRIEQCNNKFKRISTDTNSVENIVDALISVESLCDEATAGVIQKALEVAGTITMAAECFPDVAVTGNPCSQETADDYLSEKSKALHAEQGGELAAARSQVRNTKEYKDILAKQ